MPKIHDTTTTPPLDADAHVRSNGKRRHRNPPPPPPPAPPRKKSSVAGKVLKFLAVAAAGGVVSHFAVKKVKSMFGKDEGGDDKQPAGMLPQPGGMAQFPQIMPMPMPYFAQIPTPQAPAPGPPAAPQPPTRNSGMVGFGDDADDEDEDEAPPRPRRNGPLDPDDVYEQTMSRLLVKRMRRKAHEDFDKFEMEDRLDDFDA